MRQHGLLVVGHGSADPTGAAHFLDLVGRVGKRLAPVPVGGGFIELSAPPLAEAVADLVADGTGALVAVPLMLVAAGHAKGDIPAALHRERHRHPGLRVAYGRPLGPHPALLAVLRERLGPATPDTTVLLVGRGSSDPDANAEVAKVARLLEETTPVAGVEYAFVSLAGPGVAAGLDRCRRLGARRVVVLPYFLFTGVLPRRVVTQAAAWSSANPGTEVRTAEVIGDCDELAGVVAERYAEALAGDVRVNCDTCMYRVALPGHEHRVGQPQLPHHHPDDPGHRH